MSQNLSSRPTPAVEKNSARKRYAAPRLEVYGTLRDLTRTSYAGLGSDLAIYSNSAPG